VRVSFRPRNRATPPVRLLACALVVLAWSVGEARAQVRLAPPVPRGDEVAAARDSALAAPKDAARWGAWGRALMRRDTVDDRIKARRVLEHAVRLAPRDIDLRLTLAELYTRQNYLTLARRELQSVLSSDSSSAPASTRLGRIALNDWLKFQRRSSLDLARRHWQEAARRAPTSPEPWLGLGVLALLDGDAEGAFAAGREVRTATRTTNARERAEAWLLEGAGAYGMGRPQLADSAFAAALPLLSTPARDHLLAITPAATDVDTTRLGGLTDSGDRERFLGTFWRKHDPDLTTPWNELRLELLARGTLAYFLFYDHRLRSWDERGNFFVRFGPPDSTDYNPPFDMAPPTMVTGMRANVLVWHYSALGFLVLFEDPYLNQRYDRPWSLTEVVDFYPRPDSLMNRIDEGGTTTAGRGVFRTRMPNAVGLPGKAQVALFRRVAGFDPRTSTAPTMFGGGGAIGAQGRLEAYLAVEGGPAADALWLESVVVREDTFEEVARARSERFAWCRSDSVQVAQFNFDLPIGRYVVGFSARDSARNAVGTWKVDALVTANLPGRIELSDVEVACSRGESGDPVFSKIEGTVIPDPYRRATRDQPLGVYFEVYHLVADEAGRSKLSFEYSVRPAKKDARIFLLKILDPKRRDPVIQVERSDEIPGRARFQYVTANMAGQEPGPYRFEVTVTDDRTGFKATKGVDFELVD